MCHSGSSQVRHCITIQDLCHVSQWLSGTSLCHGSGAMTHVTVAFRYVIVTRLRNCAMCHSNYQVCHCVTAMEHTAKNKYMGNCLKSLLFILSITILFSEPNTCIYVYVKLIHWIKT